jgi:hypothetical protein
VTFLPGAMLTVGTLELAEGSIVTGPSRFNSAAAIELSVCCRRCARQGPSSVPLAEPLDVVRFRDELLDRLGLDADMSKLPTG